MGCIAVKVAIVIYERGTFDQTFQWLTGAEEDPVVLTGYSADFTVRETMASAVALLALTEEAGPWAADGDSGIYFDDAITGEYRLYINDADTQALCASHVDIAGFYDLFLTDSAGEVVLKQYGKCTIKAAVGR